MLRGILIFTTILLLMSLIGYGIWISICTIKTGKFSFKPCLPSNKDWKLYKGKNAFPNQCSGSSYEKCTEGVYKLGGGNNEPKTYKECEQLCKEKEGCKTWSFPYVYENNQPKYCHGSDKIVGDMKKHLGRYSGEYVEKSRY